MTPDQFEPAKRSWIMARIKSKDTKAELLLRRELRKRGLYYRVNFELVPGKPDVFFPRARVAVFVDGAFWHGQKLSSDRLSKLSPYWQTKIERNQRRDRSITRELEQQGYIVIRLAEQAIFKNVAKIADEIETTVKEAGSPTCHPHLVSSPTDS